MRRPIDSRSGGFVLILCSSLLVLLTFVAVAFLTICEPFRKSGRLRVDTVRAHLLATSGFERAVAEVRRGAESTYGGEDYDGDGRRDDGTVEETAEVYRPGVLDRDRCPLEHALRPSFFSRADGWRDDGGNPAPDRTGVGGRPRGFSGRLRATYVDARDSRGDTYALRVEVSPGIHVNGGELATAGTTAGTYDETLRRVLGTLAEAIDREDGTDDGLPVDQADGERLVDARPPGGWTSAAALVAGALGGNTRKGEALLPYLALRAWVDRKVIRPNATVGMVGSTPRSWGEIKLAHAGPAPEFEPAGRAPVYLDWAREHPPALLALLSGLRGVWLDEGSATPVLMGDTVGTLRSVNIALNGYDPTADLCLGVAAAIRLTRRPLRTWEEWATFCDSLIQEEDANMNGVLDAGEDVDGDGRMGRDEDLDRDGGLGAGELDSDGNGLADIRPFKTGTLDERRALADLLKANFNPNSDLNKFNPNPTMWKTVDKGDLLAYSTEFTLYPVNGFRVESVGRLVDWHGGLSSSVQVSAEVGGPSVLRLTTQREFVAADLGVPDVAGDPREVAARMRVPGDPAFISESRGLAPTHGHAWNLPAWTADDGVSRGISLQPYPEPYYEPAPGAGAAIVPADYDGSLQLATVETQKDSQMRMLGRYDDGYDLDEYGATLGGSAGVVQDPSGRMATGDQLAGGLLDPDLPAALYPDGCYSERGRIPAYKTAGNLDGYHAVVSFWVKPNYRRVVRDLWFTSVAKNTTRCRRYLQLTNYDAPYASQTVSDGFMSSNQFFALVDSTSWQMSERNRFGYRMHFEMGHTSGPGDTGQEHQYSAPGLKGPHEHRWRLITAQWDFRMHNQDAPHTGRIVVDQGGGDNIGQTDNYWCSQYYATCESITRPDMRGDHLLALGTGSIPEWYADVMLGGGPDATFDEFGFWDIGGIPGEEVLPPGGSTPLPPGGSTPLPPGGSTPGGVVVDPFDLAAQTDAIASTRYLNGRYYRGAAYRALGFAGLPVQDEAPAYLTAPIEFVRGSLLREVRWTWHRPRALPRDYAGIELTDRDGIGYLWGADESRTAGYAGGWNPARQEWHVGRRLAGPFRARVVFRRDTPAPSPILDSPVFDDLTLLVEPPSGVALLSWQEW